jgi:hypothetical protein
MAAAHSTSKLRSGRNLAKPKVGRRKKPATPVSDVPSRGSHGRSHARTRQAIRVADALRAFLESEREQLMKVESLLVCARKAMELEPKPTEAYYPDVLGLAADVLRRRVVNLDELLLDGVVPRESARSNR